MLKKDIETFDKGFRTHSTSSYQVLKPFLQHNVVVEPHYVARMVSELDMMMLSVYEILCQMSQNPS